MKKISLVFLILFWFFSESQALGQVETIFSPKESIRETLLKGIESATTALDLAIYEITSSDMSQALLRAKRRGVKVRVITDSKKAKIRSSKITFLIHEGIPVKVLGGKEKGGMIHRFAIVDGKKVFTGSFDWSEGPGQWNYENLLIIQDKEIVSSYQIEFDSLWREKRVIK